jgi:hypothetical protein
VECPTPTVGLSASGRHADANPPNGAPAMPEYTPAELAVMLHATGTYAYLAATADE